MKYNLHFLALALCVLSSCAVLPKNTHNSAYRIPTGAGPEDLVLDTFTVEGRLIISCNAHRLREEAPQGDIYMLDLEADSLVSAVLPRLEEPEGLDFHPHGIYLTPDERNEHYYLFVISHNDKEKKHSVIKYELLEDALVFQQEYQNPLITSPNSVAALPDGSFYITNDLGKRGSTWQALMKMKTGSIVYCTADGQCATAANKLGYANGLLLQDKHYLYTTTTRQGKVFRYVLEYNGNLLDRQKVGKMNGGDNIRFDDDDLIGTAHVRILKFAKHFKKAHKKAPSVVYRINPETQERTVLYANDGEQISAASTAVVYKNHLYIGQVFESYIVQVPLLLESKD